MAGEDEGEDRRSNPGDGESAENPTETAPVEPDRPIPSPRALPPLDVAFRDSQTDEWIMPVEPQSALEVRAVSLPVPRPGAAVDVYDERPAELLPSGPSALEADSWDAAPPAAPETDGYRGRRRAAPVSRARLIVAVVLVVAAAAVAIPWTLTLGRSGGAVGWSPPLADGVTGDGDDSGSSAAPTASPSASALVAVGASPARSSEQPPPSPASSPASTPPPVVVLLSQGRPTATSSQENGSLAGPKAVDGKTGTRWSSAFADPQWISVDLGAVCAITRVRLSWEAAYGRAYELQTSVDNATWTTIYTTTTGDGGEDDVTVTGAGRWVRLFGTQRFNTQWGYSLWELEIFGFTQ